MITCNKNNLYHKVSHELSFKSVSTAIIPSGAVLVVFIVRFVGMFFLAFLRKIPFYFTTRVDI